MGYHCLNEYFSKGIKQDLFHMDNCTCHVAQKWFYEVADQSSHIQAFLEYHNIVRAYWDKTYGLLLEFKDFDNIFNKTTGWPYRNEWDIRREKETHKRWKRYDSNKKRARMLRRYWCRHVR